MKHLILLEILTGADTWTSESQPMSALARIQADPRTKEVCNEGEDGWWVMLADGYCWPEGQTHAIHERTLKAVWRELRTVRLCHCSECKILNTHDL